MWRIGLFGLAMMLCGGVPARAMEFASRDLPDGHRVLEARGVILWGDFSRLLRQIDSVAKVQRLSYLVLDSPGGLVFEAEKMAVTIHNIGIPVAVAGSGQCASACALLFAAAPRRAVGDGARIGLHRASFLGQGNTRRENTHSQGATDGMALELAQFGVPAPIIARMQQTPPDTVTWLTPSDLALMKVAVYRAPKPLAVTE